MSPVSIMLIDDSPTFLKYVALFLQQYPAEVMVVGTASGAEEGLALAAQRCPDVTLVDLKMPGRSGLDVIPQLKSVGPGAGVIAVTLHDDSHYRQAAIEAGADDFVAKSELTTALMPAIRKVAAANTGRMEHLIGGSGHE